MDELIYYYEATILKEDNTTVPMAKVIKVDIEKDPRETVNNWKRKFMNMILEEIEEWDLLVWVQSNMLDVKEEDIIL